MVHNLAKLIEREEFNFSGINWGNHSGVMRKAGKFLDGAEDNILSQVLSEQIEKELIGKLVSIKLISSKHR